MVAGSAPAPKRSVAVLNSPPARPGFGPSAAVQIVGRPREHEVAERVGREARRAGARPARGPEPVIAMVSGSPTRAWRSSAERTRASARRCAGAGSARRRATRTTGPACSARTPRARSRSGGCRARRRSSADGVASAIATPRIACSRVSSSGPDRALEAHLRVDTFEARRRGRSSPAPSRRHQSARGSRRARARSSPRRPPRRPARASVTRRRGRERGDGVREERRRRRPRRSRRRPRRTACCAPGRRARGRR